MLAVRAKWHSCLESTAGHILDRSFRLFTTSICAIRAGFLLATKFQMGNKDVIYASNALSVESSKFLNYLRLIIATAEDPVLAATNVYILRNTIGAATSTVAVPTGSSAGVVIPAP
jgi:hypothetical protein